MSEFFSSGRAVDVVLAVLLVEALLLFVRGRDPSQVVSALLPAALMMIALRAALTGLAWPWIAMPLAAAFPIHLLDLRARRIARRKEPPR